MPLNQDFAELIHHLNTANAKYLVIGAYAVMIYTFPRYTKDIDFLIEPTSENAEKVYEALKVFGAPLETVSAEDLKKSDMVLQIGVEPNRIDIITSIEGARFEELWKNKKEERYGEEPIYIPSLEDLVQIKKLAGRPGDLKDIEILSKAAKFKKS